MPERTRLLQAQTPVQGEDSYVKYTLPNVGEVEEALKFSDEGNEKSFAFGRKLISDHIVEWNWVDYDGSVLPSPAETPLIVRALTLSEYKALLEVLLGNEEDRKN